MCWQGLVRDSRGRRCVWGGEVIFGLGIVQLCLGLGVFRQPFLVALCTNAFYGAQGLIRLVPGRLGHVPDDALGGFVQKKGLLLRLTPELPPALG